MGGKCILITIQIRKALPGFFLCIFSSLTCLKKPVFFCGGGRYQPGYTGIFWPVEGTSQTREKFPALLYVGKGPEYKPFSYTNFPSSSHHCCPSREVGRWHDLEGEEEHGWARKKERPTAIITLLVSLSCLSSLQLQTTLMLFYDQSRHRLRALSGSYRRFTTVTSVTSEIKTSSSMLIVHIRSSSDQLLIHSFIMSRREREMLLGFRVKIRVSWTVTMMMIARGLMASEIDPGESKDVDKWREWQQEIYY